MDLKHFSRYLTGTVFVFSGLVKGIDPLGSMYKFTDYFTAFSLDAFEPAAYFLGILLCSAEFIIGFALVSGLRIKEAAWGLFIFMCFFTPLTLFLALSNPVSDCGCFGDAVKLSNWETFYKNIIILSFAIIVLVKRNNYPKAAGTKIEWIVLILVLLLFNIFINYNRNHLPVIDFRPYKTGVNIPEAMAMPENAPVDEYETVLIYEKDGKQEEFTLENYPSEDSGWVFVDSKSKLIKEGYTPPIHDFSLTNSEGLDITDVVISDDSFSFLMLSIDPDEADEELILKGTEVGKSCLDQGIPFYILTSSGADKFSSYGNEFTLLFVDETTLKTIIRANPGFISLKSGTITGKWAGKDISTSLDIVEQIRDSVPVKQDKPGLKLFIMLLSIIIMAIILNYLTRKLFSKKV